MAAQAIIIVVIDVAVVGQRPEAAVVATEKKKILEIAVKSHETKKPLNQTSKKTTVGDPRPLGSRGPTWSHPGCPGVQLMPVTGIVTEIGKLATLLLLFVFFR